MMVVLLKECSCMWLLFFSGSEMLIIFLLMKYIELFVLFLWNSSVLVVSFIFFMCVMSDVILCVLKCLVRLLCRVLCDLFCMVCFSRWFFIYFSVRLRLVNLCGVVLLKVVCVIGWWMGLVMLVRIRVILYCLYICVSLMKFCEVEVFSFCMWWKLMMMNWCGDCNCLCI